MSHRPLKINQIASQVMLIQHLLKTGISLLVASVLHRDPGT